MSLKQQAIINNIPAYSVTSLHFEHSVAWGAEKVLTGHILQLQRQKTNNFVVKENPYLIFISTFGYHSPKNNQMNMNKNYGYL